MEKRDLPLWMLLQREKIRYSIFQEAVERYYSRFRSEKGETFLVVTTVRRDHIQNDFWPL